MEDSSHQSCHNHDTSRCQGEGQDVLQEVRQSISRQLVSEEKPHEKPHEIKGDIGMYHRTNTIGMEQDQSNNLTDSQY